MMSFERSADRNLPFQPSVGIQTSKRMSESLVGLIEPATRQAVVTIAGLNVAAGTTVAVVIVVSGRRRPVRLSQDIGLAAYAGAERSTANAIASLFMGNLPSINEARCLPRPHRRSAARLLRRGIRPSAASSRPSPPP